METKKTAVPRIIPCSILILSGTLLGRFSLGWELWFLLSLAVFLFMFIRPNTCFRLTASLGILLLMSTWSSLNRQTVHETDLMTATGYDNDPILVHIHGDIIEKQGTRIDIDSSYLLVDGAIRPAHGRIVVRLPRTADFIGPGDFISVRGWLHGIRESKQDEPDWKSIAIDGDYRGWMRLSSMDLIQVLAVHDASPWSALKTHARNRLLSPPVPESGPERTLLAGLLLGMRGESWNEVSTAFRKTGISHLLAISGLHVSLVLVLIMPIVRFGGSHRRWHSIVAVTIVSLYISIIETRTPILRAGIMSAFLYVPFIFNRRIPVKGVLALTMCLLLVIGPGIVSHISFQLSFGVVTALVFLSPSVQRRVFPGTIATRSNPATLFKKWIQTGLVASSVAWLISMPITIHNFGQLSFMAVPMTLVMTPVVCIIMCTAAVRLLFGWIQQLDELMGHLLVIEIRLLDNSTRMMSGLEFLSVEDLQAGVVWSMAATLWVVSWCLVERRRPLLLPPLLGLILWILIGHK